MSAIRSAFNQASSDYNEHALLQQEVAIRLSDKFNVIAPNAEVILDLGAGTGLLSKQVTQRFPQAKILALDFAQESLKHNPATHKICANAQHLPLADNSVDIITSSLMMQWCEDLSILFSECFRVLKNDGLLLFSSFGPDTLKELKKSWSVVDGAQHVNDFVDMHDVGDQLLQNGFNAPVMEMEHIVLTYQSVIDLLKDLKAIGAQSVEGREKSLTGKAKFTQMIKSYESYRRDGKLPATYEVVYGHAWKHTNALGEIGLNNR